MRSKTPTSIRRCRPADRPAPEPGPGWAPTWFDSSSVPSGWWEPLQSSFLCTWPCPGPVRSESRTASPPRTNPVGPQQSELGPHWAARERAGTRPERQKGSTFSPSFLSLMFSWEDERWTASWDEQKHFVANRRLKCLKEEQSKWLNRFWSEQWDWRQHETPDPVHLHSWSQLAALC